jgi:hypothetical protein
MALGERVDWRDTFRDWTLDQIEYVLEMWWSSGLYLLL